jgi:hypothetical protein
VDTINQKCLWLNSNGPRIKDVSGDPYLENTMKNTQLRTPRGRYASEDHDRWDIFSISLGMLLSRDHEKNSYRIPDPDGPGTGFVGTAMRWLGEKMWDPYPDIQESQIQMVLELDSSELPWGDWEKKCGILIPIFKEGVMGRIYPVIPERVLRGLNLRFFEISSYLTWYGIRVLFEFN